MSGDFCLAEALVCTGAGLLCCTVSFFHQKKHSIHRNKAQPLQSATTLHNISGTFCLLSNLAATGFIGFYFVSRVYMCDSLLAHMQADLEELVPFLPAYVAVQGTAQLETAVRPVRCKHSNEKAVIGQVFALPNGTFCYFKVSTVCNTHISQEIGSRMAVTCRGNTHSMSKYGIGALGAHTQDWSKDRPTLQNGDCKITAVLICLL